MNGQSEDQIGLERRAGGGCSLRAVPLLLGALGVLGVLALTAGAGQLPTPGAGMLVALLIVCGVMLFAPVQSVRGTQRRRRASGGWDTSSGDTSWSMGWGDGGGGDSGGGDCGGGGDGGGGGE
jgi:hypothetical protein